MDQSDVRVSALAIVTDLLIWHGLPAFMANENTEVPSNLEAMMNSETQDPTLSHLVSYSLLIYFTLPLHSHVGLPSFSREDS